ncbi:GNAT family N-acetyltransferase [Hymenobacter sp. BT175]|uniref:GNAT family N-acetyltransferase n=1 Tax=Hymenobacter translucens TaxID=2886507 RepID=UPI001D0E943E|nr:GNAT family N-acetyltransferase [Hymenobacter translucens]MCC2547289.1 GNAT family N-acetyltransferase [Hymenobacter translucens]
MIETPRLLLLPCTLPLFEAARRSDEALATLLEVSCAPEWLGFPDARDALVPGHEHLKAHPEVLPWWTYLFVHRPHRRLIGVGGYKGMPDAAGRVEIGYSLAPSYRGQGLATEAARGLVSFAFRHPAVRRVDAHTRPLRNASGRVLEKTGLRKTGAVVDPDDGEVWHWTLERPPGS